jgi:phage protein D
MSLAKLASSTSNFYVPRFEIKIEGSKLPPALANSIMDISVVEKINEGARFTFKVHDEFDMKDEKFKWLDHKLLDVGSKVAISMGYGSDLEEMMTGKITDLSPVFFTGEPPSITVSGYDLTYEIMKTWSSGAHPFKNMTVSDIAGQIAKKAGLKAVMDKTTEKVNRTKANNVTYLAFLQEQADNEGFQLRIDRDTLYFKKPEDDKKEIYTLVLGKDIISFKPKMNTSQILPEVEVRGHDSNNPAKAIVGKAKAGSERTQESGRQTASQWAKKKTKTEKKVINNAMLESVNQANNRALAVLNRANDTFIMGDVECVGIPKIRAGVCIKLEKMGERFSGKYYVVGTTHKIGESGYRTTFEVKRNAV